MEKPRNSGGTDILLDRAEPPREKRYIFSGDSRPVPPGYVIPPNRRRSRRRVSTFNILLTLFGAGIAIVLYVNSILTINRLALEVDRLQARCDALTNANAALRADVSRKSGWDRIGAVATGQLGLAYPREQPTVLEVDESAFGTPPATNGAR